MKKIVFVALSLAVLSAFSLGAQEGPAKANHDLPEEGDWAVSVSAVPILRYIGQFFNGTNGNQINQFGGDPYLVNQANIQLLNPVVSLSLKYMLADDWALRVNAGWLYNNVTTRVYAPDDAALQVDPLSEAKVIDTRFVHQNGVSLMVGAEKRVGKRNIQGIFGAGLLYAMQMQVTTYAYGNAITEFNQSPSVGLAGTAPAGVNNAFTSLRYLNNQTAGCNNYAGAVLIAGVEWFVAPKISLGGEVNVAAIYSWNAPTHYTAEGYNHVNGAVEQWTQVQTPSSSGFSFGTGNIGANLSVNFYF